MKVMIEERKIGNILAMPSYKNIKNPPKGWTLTRCPKCRQYCWKREGDEEIEKLLGAVSYCTECALRISRNS